MALSINGPGAVPALTLATDLTVADHAGRLLTMDPAATRRLQSTITSNQCIS